MAEDIPRTEATNIRQEVALPGIVADVQMTNAQGPLLLEVAVSHKEDSEKRQNLEALDWRCIEIDLSRASDRRLLSTQNRYSAGSFDWSAKVLSQRSFSTMCS